MEKYKKNKAQVKRQKPKLTLNNFFKLFYSDVRLAKELIKPIFSKKEIGAYDGVRFKNLGKNGKAAYRSWGIKTRRNYLYPTLYVIPVRVH